MKTFDITFNSYNDLQAFKAVNTFGILTDDYYEDAHIAYDYEDCGALYKFDDEQRANLRVASVATRAFVIIEADAHETVEAFLKENELRYIEVEENDE